MAKGFPSCKGYIKGTAWIMLRIDGGEMTYNDKLCAKIRLKNAIRIMGYNYNLTSKFPFSYI